MLQELLKDCKFTQVANRAASATTAVTSGAAIDMQGFDGVLYVCSIDIVTDNSVLTLTAYELSTNAVSGGTAITGGATTAVTAATSAQQLFIVDIVRPSLRYNYVTFTRSAQVCTVNCILAIQYRARTLPVTQPTGAQGVAASILTTPPEN